LSIADSPISGFNAMTALLILMAICGSNAIKEIDGTMLVGSCYCLACKLCGQFDLGKDADDHALMRV